MKHVFMKNGSITYELEPEDEDDRHVIALMKSKDSVKMRQGSKGGIIFDMERTPTASSTVLQPKPEEEDAPVDLSNVPRVSKP